jgi:hypothetical protein
MTHKEDIERLRTMQRFLIDDLKKLEYHTNELIENIYTNGKQKQFNKDIEQIEIFFSYWRQHAKNLNI